MLIDPLLLLLLAPLEVFSWRKTLSGKQGPTVGVMLPHLYVEAI